MNNNKTAELKSDLSFLELINDKKIADSFVDNILSKGGTLKAMEMYTNFRGREPQVDALLKRSGLK